MDKSFLRKQLLEKRNSMQDDEASYKSSQIAKKLLALKQIKSAKIVALYHQFKTEVATDQIIQSLLLQGKTILLPFMDLDNIKFSKINSLQGLVKSKNGILEPSQKVAVDPNSIDVFIVPALGFDPSGYRVGSGKGYYDKFFNETKAAGQKIGLAFDFQVVKKVPNEPHDVKMDLVVSEKRIYRPLEI
ncbi:MAG TPA: 5-formyltetrahydrofolate cyclo-ligase [archaeon]|nr:5-formyltetrahydrofolate cyclo-ligase [archaeon]